MLHKYYCYESAISFKQPQPFFPPINAQVSRNCLTASLRQCIAFERCRKMVELDIVVGEPIIEFLRLPNKILGNAAKTRLYTKGKKHNITNIISQIINCVWLQGGIIHSDCWAELKHHLIYIYSFLICRQGLIVSLKVTL